MDDPTEVVILQYSDGDERSHRHTERFRITGRLPWEGWSELKGALCSKFGVPPGVAAGLVNELIAKAISPKVTDADLGYRPVR